MIRMDRILLATDFSECAAAAQQYALSFAERFGSRLHVLHVIADPAATWQLGLQIALPSYAQDLPQRMHAAEQEWAAQELARLFPQTGGPHDPLLLIRQGKPFIQITRYAAEEQIDLIVMGTHGRGMVLHALMGSVAENVVRHAGCPVLTVRADDSRAMQLEPAS
jgi:nucleotide-binding universal stress UspA family protein